MFSQRNELRVKSIITVLVFAATLSLSSFRGQEVTSESAAPNECSPEMSESECEDKIERDLASAIRNNPSECTFEPDWRPTHLSEHTLRVMKVNHTLVLVVIAGKNYNLEADSLGDDNCQEKQGHNCPRWTPETGRVYLATIIDRPEYLNDCLHRMLPARRTLCVGFGKIKKEVFKYGVTRTPEFETCHSIPPV